jgi:hypothetical protein
MPSKKKSNNTKKMGNGRNNNAGTKALTTRGLASALMQLNENRRPNTVSASHLRGSDFITTVNTATGDLAAQTGSILASFPISPSAYPGTRLTSLSQLWERFRFTSLSLRYVPAVPMTIACQFIIYIDTDPLDDPNTIPNADAIIRQATAQAKSQQFNFNKAKNISLCVRKDDQLYYTGADKQNLRFSNQGTAYIIQVTPVMDFNGGIIDTGVAAGSIYLDWNVCFDIPQINPSAIQSTSWSVVPTSFPSTLKTFYVVDSSGYVLAPTLTLEPNQAYLASLFTVAANVTVFAAGVTDTLSVDLETSVPNSLATLTNRFDPAAITSGGAALLITGSDGVVRTSLGAVNNMEFDAFTSGEIYMAFEPISF